MTNSPLSYSPLSPFFEELCQQISERSPHTATGLAALDEICGTQFAYNAAMIMLWLIEREDTAGIVPLQNLTVLDLQSFKFFELAQNDEDALHRFTQLFLNYQREQLVAAGK